MNDLQANGEESLSARAASDCFASTSALVVASEPPASWGYECFRRCRTFDEVKALARTKNLQAANELGQIQLWRQGQLIARFWLFD
jgi:hypothetical protein